MFLLWLRQLPQCEDRTPASVLPHAKCRSSPANTPVFPLVPSSYQVLGGFIYSFPLVGYSSLPSAGVLRALMYLKVYSWCVRRERGTHHPPTPPQSCSLPLLCFTFAFSDDIGCEASFHMLIYHLYVFFYEVSIHVFSPFFKLTLQYRNGILFLYL